MRVQDKDKTKEQPKDKLMRKHQRSTQLTAIETERKTGDIIVKIDAEGRWTFVNDEACQFWGG